MSAKPNYLVLARTLDAPLVARAIEFADAAALGSLSSTCGVSTKGGWRICHEYDYDEDYIIYLAERGLIERDPKRAARYRVTKAGLAVRDDDGPSR